MSPVVMKPQKLLHLDKKEAEGGSYKDLRGWTSRDPKPCFIVYFTLNGKHNLLNKHHAVLKKTWN